MKGVFKGGSRSMHRTNSPNVAGQAVNGVTGAVGGAVTGAAGAATAVVGGALTGITAFRDNMQADLTAAERAEQMERMVGEQAEKLARIEQAVGMQSFRRRLMPQFVVTLPKYVIMDNPKLSLLTWVLKALFLALFGLMLTFGDSYNLIKRPDIKVSMCGAQCPTDAYLSDDLAVCPDAGTALLQASTEYSGALCSKRCGAGGSPGSCLHAHERYEISKYGESGAWIPTFYQEDFSLPEASSGCPSGFSSSNGVCTKAGSYFVAGAEQVRMAFTHEISVRNDEAFLMGRALHRSHQGAFHSDGGRWDEAVTTVLFNAAGEEVTWWGQKNGGQFVNVSLQTLIESAWYGDIPETGADGKEETKAPLSIDASYKRADVGMAEELPMRLTGGQITVDLFVTDTGKCKVFDSLRQDAIRTVDVAGGKGRPVACMFVHVDQKPTYVKESLPVGHQGGTRERKTHGFRIKFRLNGEVPFLDEFAIARRVTMFCVLMQIPLVLVRFFVVTCLGRLSTIYSRVMNQELNLAEACKGLAARLISHSAPFMDHMDGTQEFIPRQPDDDDGGQKTSETEKVDIDFDAPADAEKGPIVCSEPGISKVRLQSRIREFLQHDDTISQEDLLRMIDFLHLELKNMTNATKEAELVNLADFSTACCTNESLSFDSLVQLFDKDRKTNILEKLFVDNDIRQVHKAAKSNSLIRSNSMGNAQKSQGQGMYSNLDALSKDLQGIITKMTDGEKRARIAGRELDIGQDIMEMLGEDPNPDGEVIVSSFPQPIRPSHRESVSLPDEVHQV